jgi:fluoroquinolone resistance protein
MLKLKELLLKMFYLTNVMMIGFPFFECNNFLLQLSFNTCNLRLASFYLLNLKQTNFNNCNLQSVDFTQSNLTEATFNSSDLSKAIFEQSTLERANFISARNYTIHPEKNRLKGVKFNKDGLYGLLSMYSIIIK